METKLIETREAHGERLAAMRSGDVGRVHSWELVTAVDGPGTRMTLFLSGCLLRCQYCHNPDTWALRDGALRSADQVMARISRYRQVFETTGGGVTFSGGEPLLQSPFVAKLLRRCKELGIHTCIDTSGFLGRRASDEMLADIDLVLLDVKSGLPGTYKRATTAELQPTLDFGRRLSALNKRIWIRFVLVPGLTDAVDNVAAVASYVASLGECVERVEVLPFHQMGRDKWQALKQPYQLEDVEPPDAELLDRVRGQFREHGLVTY